MAPNLDRRQGRQVVVSVSCPIAVHGESKPESHSVFDARLGSSDVLREGAHSSPASTLSWTLAAATPAASLPIPQDVFEGFNLAEGHHLRRAHGTESQQQTLAG